MDLSLWPAAKTTTTGAAGNESLSSNQAALVAALVAVVSQPHDQKYFMLSLSVNRQPPNKSENL